jgi:hypothetical protein
MLDAATSAATHEDVEEIRLRLKRVAKGEILGAARKDVRDKFFTPPPPSFGFETMDFQELESLGVTMGESWVGIPGNVLVFGVNGGPPYTPKLGEFEVVVDALGNVVRTIQIDEGGATAFTGGEAFLPVRESGVSGDISVEFSFP